MINIKDINYVPNISEISVYIENSAFDELYQQSKNGNNFYKLLEIIGSEQNICLAYRNLKTNSGSKTAGTDGKTIEDIKGLSDREVI